jgi:hypothetical protein
MRDVDGIIDTYGFKSKNIMIYDKSNAGYIEIVDKMIHEKEV